MGSYYISTKRSEGVCSTDVQVSLIVSLQEADVIVALGLQRKGRETQFISGSRLTEAGEKVGQSVHIMYRGYFMQIFNGSL